MNSIITLEGILELVCPVDRMRTLLDVSDVRDLVGEKDLGYVRVPTFIVLSAWLSVKPRLPTYTQMTTDKVLLPAKLINQSYQNYLCFCAMSALCS